ncbi:prepilin-type N-terminal cleavage/methylation domain-containing protein [Heliorestis acidaminivorans]|uniref:Prepilin-type N-terminal cleavage/methylation domain-containing protein n=1 Tax=Heliorestis acidaminivorans TaxID=553427 RepID=A0A6I0EQK8_9FIRM|nr:chitobiase/beta-hexosaminidase C-terminal domain-containing protein [Heliorestis acidaminivorans]KAB2951656.1 prepilin-type N-terminal cleavage/methylation domain-containing protein [Heliorestis acidaminivorans]
MKSSNRKNNGRINLEGRLTLEGGFTLVELLITIALLGLIMAMGASFFAFGINAFQKGEAQSIAQRDVRFVADRITQELRNATMVEFGSNSDEVPAPAEGDLFFSMKKIEGTNYYRINFIKKDSPPFSITPEGVISDYEFRVENRVLKFKLAGEEKGQSFAIESEVLLVNSLSNSPTNACTIDDCSYIYFRKDLMDLNKVRSPYALPVEGSYRFSPTIIGLTSDDVIELRSNTSGASLCYTLDGSDPDEACQASNVYTYSDTSKISLAGYSGDLTLKARAVKEGMDASELFELTYRILERVATPIANPAAVGLESFFLSNNVAIELGFNSALFSGSTATGQSTTDSSTSDEPTICYTLEDNVPIGWDSETNSCVLEEGLYLYSGPIADYRNNRGNFTLRAQAFQAGMLPSFVLEKRYHYDVEGVLPVIIIFDEGNEPLAILRGQSFNPLAGVNVINGSLGDLTITGAVDRNSVGVYTLTYSIGSVSEVRTVHVRPVLSSVEFRVDGHGQGEGQGQWISFSLFPGFSSYNLTGYSATKGSARDNEDANIEIRVTAPEGNVKLIRGSTVRSISKDLWQDSGIKGGELTVQVESNDGFLKTSYSFYLNR